eukprot:1777223-Prymnesium_polylepis.1
MKLKNVAFASVCAASTSSTRRRGAQGLGASFTPPCSAFVVPVAKIAPARQPTAAPPVRVPHARRSLGRHAAPARARSRSARPAGAAPTRGAG